PNILEMSSGRHMELVRNLTSRFSGAMSLSDQFSRGYIEENRCILLEFDGTSALIGVCDPDAKDLLDELHSAFLSLHRDAELVSFCRIEYSELLALLGVQGVADSSTDSTEDGSRQYGSTALDARSDSGPVISLVNTVLLEA